MHGRLLRVQCDAHVAQDVPRGGGRAIDSQSARRQGYRGSQTIRQCIEEHFTWGKAIGDIRQAMACGIRLVDQHFKRPMIASNI